MPYTEKHMAVTKERLEDLRKEKKLSYEQLSKLLEEQGSPISHTNLKNYGIDDPEHRLYNRTRGMSIENLVALADVFDVSVDYLLGRSDSRKEEYHQISEELRLSDGTIDTLKQFIEQDNDEQALFGQRTLIIDELFQDENFQKALGVIRQAAYSYEVFRATSHERFMAAMQDEEYRAAEEKVRSYGMQTVDASMSWRLHVTHAASLVGEALRTLPLALVEYYSERLPEHQGK